MKGGNQTFDSNTGIYAAKNQTDPCLQPPDPGFIAVYIIVRAGTRPICFIGGSFNESIIIVNQPTR
jgi:hypothetical protein